MTDPILTVILRRAVPDDAADYALMMGDPEVFPGLMQLPMPSQLLRIELGVFTDNAPAIALYQRFGFRHEGAHRGYALRHGLYADVHSMARLHPNPPTIAWPAPSAP